MSQQYLAAQVTDRMKKKFEWRDGKGIFSIFDGDIYFSFIDTFVPTKEHKEIHLYKCNNTKTSCSGTLYQLPSTSLRLPRTCRFPWVSRINYTKKCM